MATVMALQSFVVRLEKDQRGPERVEKHSQLGESRFPGKLLKEGKSAQVVKGDLYEDNHPIVKAVPTMFGKVESVHSEKATQPLAEAKK